MIRCLVVLQARLRLQIALATSIALGGGACSLLSLDNLEEGGGVTSGETSASASASESSASTQPISTSGSSSGPGSSVASSSNGGQGGDVGDGGAGAGTVTQGPGPGGAGPGSGSTAGSGGEGGTPIVTSPCESTPILDDFNRADGPLGASWIDVDNLAVIGERAQNDPTDAGYKRSRWGVDFGPDQEAHVIFSEIDPAGDEQLLLMKIQGQSNIEVLYAPSSSGIEVWTCTPSCVLQAQLDVTVPEGTRFAARATADGTVRVCLDGDEVLTADITDWAGHDNGGGIGLATLHYDRSDLAFAFDDFGGGNVSE